MSKQPRLVERQHPLYSPVAIFATFVLLLILGLALWRTGGRAELSAVAYHQRQSGGFASHATFGDDCQRCHEPLVGVTAERCESCHLTISEQRTNNTGLHGRLTSDDCTLCHTEHQGQEVDLFTAAFGQFTNEHHAALFPLHGAHAELECADCHANEQFVGTASQCVGCHTEPELHKGLFGTDCGRCHTAEGWQPAQLTIHTFPLDHGGGLPAAGQIPCATCHTATFASYTCAACHAPAEMIEEHEKEDISAVELENCVECHPTGLKE